MFSEKKCFFFLNKKNKISRCKQNMQNMQNLQKKIDSMMSYFGIKGIWIKMKTIF